jgi:LemA protein
MGSKGLLAVLIIIPIILVIAYISISNHLVTLDENVNEKWAQVENVYQRRADLIPNLVETVKGYASHERETLNEVIQARSMAQKASGTGQALTTDAGAFGQFQQAQAALSSALSRLLVVVERYPDLKANQNFLTLQSQLEGTENRITVERKRYNEAARKFNTTIRKFPYKFFAAGYKKREYFKADAGAEKAPKVSFK